MAYSQATITVPFTPVLPYDSPLVPVVGDGRPDPNLPPPTTIPVGPDLPPTYWGPRLFPASGRIRNMAFRATVPAGGDLVGGLVIGEGGSVVLVRAVGPTLATFGISGYLPRPQLRVYNAAGGLIASAVPWSTNSSMAQNELLRATDLVRAFRLRQGSEDQVLLLYLDRGTYTCVVTGIENSSGVVLLEGYEVKEEMVPVPPPERIVPSTPNG
jgi:hypothetical protein